MPQAAMAVRALVDIAGTLVDDFDVVDLLTHLATECTGVLGISAAGIMVASPRGDLRLLASSSEAMRLLECFEIQAREGPCLDAFRTGAPVPHEILGVGTERWPRFSIAALHAGFQSVLALPLRLRSTTIGALGLFSADRAPLLDAELGIARAFAHMATLSILQQRRVDDSSQLADQLGEALTSRIVIEQAKGVLAERSRIGMDEAFLRLRTSARAHNLRLADVARSLIDGTPLPGS